MSWIPAPSPSVSIPTAVLTETKAQGVASAVIFNSTIGYLRPRQFNVPVNNGLLITLQGTPNWTFTIPSAGTYLFDAVAFYTYPASNGAVLVSKLFLNNQTATVPQAIVGMSAYMASGGGYGGNANGTNNACFLNGILTLTGTTVFSLDHQVGGISTGGNAAGYAIEIYATIKIIKLA